MKRIKQMYLNKEKKQSIYFKNRLARNFKKTEKILNL